MALLGRLERVLTFGGSHQNPPFADNGRLLLMPKNCAINQNYNELNLLKKKFPKYQQRYSQKWWKKDGKMKFKTKLTFTQGAKSGPAVFFFKFGRPVNPGLRLPQSPS